MSIGKRLWGALGTMTFGVPPGTRACLHGHTTQGIRMTFPHRNCLIVLALALMVTSVPALADAARAPIVKAVTNPQPPALSVTTFKGQPFDLAAQRGKWVLVYVWGSWCIPCMDAMPVIAQFIAQHPDVTAIGLDMEESSRNRLAPFLAAHAFDFPLAPIDKAQARQFVPFAIPVTWVIAPDGTARQRWLGGFNAAQLDQLMHNVGYVQSRRAMHAVPAPAN